MFSQVILSKERKLRIKSDVTSERWHAFSLKRQRYPTFCRRSYWFIKVVVMKSSRWRSLLLFSGPSRLVSFVLIMLQEPISASYQILLSGLCKIYIYDINTSICMVHKTKINQGENHDNSISVKDWNKRPTTYCTDFLVCWFVNGFVINSSVVFSILNISVRV
jgi:hypothetical protein